MTGQREMTRVICTELRLKAVFGFVPWNGRHTGVVTQDRQLVVVFTNPCSELGNGRQGGKTTFTNVECRTRRVSGLTYVLCRLLTPVDTPAGYHDRRTAVSECFRCLVPEATVRSRYDNPYQSSKRLSSV